MWWEIYGYANADCQVSTDSTPSGSKLQSSDCFLKKSSDFTSSAIPHDATPGYRHTQERSQQGGRRGVPEGALAACSRIHLSIIALYWAGIFLRASSANWSSFSACDVSFDIISVKSTNWKLSNKRRLSWQWMRSSHGTSPTPTRTIDRGKWLARMRAWRVLSSR